jgi:hypothetical protein
VGALKRAGWRSPTAWLENTTCQNLTRGFLHSYRVLPMTCLGRSHPHCACTCYSSCICIGRKGQECSGCGRNIPVWAMFCHGWLSRWLRHILIKLFDPMSIERPICPMYTWPHSQGMLGSSIPGLPWLPERRLKFSW